MNKEKIPVYLISGLLESGKTTFIKEKIKDPSFYNNERILLLICEDGFIEYDDINKEYENIKFCYINDLNLLKKEYLEGLSIGNNYSMIIIEYNGIWFLDALYNNLPLSWMIYQQILMIDSKTYNSYSNMFRNFLVDKIQKSESCIFTKYIEKYDKDYFHKSIRMFSKKINIYYEDLEHNRVKDIKLDPLPFDIEKNEINIQLRDYAIWFQDLIEETKKYDKKIISFSGKVDLDNKGNYLFGRRVMVCCEADIKFLGLYIVNPNEYNLRFNKWYEIKGRLHSDTYYPSIMIKELKEIETPNINEEVATFF